MGCKVRYRDRIRNPQQPNWGCTIFCLTTITSWQETLKDHTIPVFRGHTRMLKLADTSFCLIFVHSSWNCPLNYQQFSILLKHSRLAQNKTNAASFDWLTNLTSNCIFREVLVLIKLFLLLLNVICYWIPWVLTIEIFHYSYTKEKFYPQLKLFWTIRFALLWYDS